MRPSRCNQRPHECNQRPHDAISALTMQSAPSRCNQRPHDAISALTMQSAPSRCNQRPHDAISALTNANCAFVAALSVMMQLARTILTMHFAAVRNILRSHPYTICAAIQITDSVIANCDQTAPIARSSAICRGCKFLIFKRCSYIFHQLISMMWSLRGAWTIGSGAELSRTGVSSVASTQCVAYYKCLNIVCLTFEISLFRVFPGQ